MRSFSILLLFALCSSVLTTGHLRLEITASHDCDLILSTEFSAQVIRMRMGDKRTSSFHPRRDEHSVAVTFSIGRQTPKSKTFLLETSEQPHRDVFVFSEVAVLIESVFECDTGFYGTLCMATKDPATSSSTSFSTSTTTTTTTVTSTSTGRVSPITSRIPKVITALPLKNESSLNNIVIVVLIFVIVTLLVFIIIVSFLLLKRQPKVYLEPTCESLELKKKCLEDSFKKDSGIQSPESVRYTAAPFTSIHMSP